MKCSLRLPGLCHSTAAWSKLSWEWSQLACCTWVTGLTCQLHRICMCTVRYHLTLVIGVRSEKTRLQTQHFAQCDCVTCMHASKVSATIYRTQFFWHIRTIRMMHLRNHTMVRYYDIVSFSHYFMHEAMTCGRLYLYIWLSRSGVPVKSRHSSTSFCKLQIVSQSRSETPDTHPSCHVWLIWPIRNTLNAEVLKLQMVMSFSCRFKSCATKVTLISDSWIRQRRANLYRKSQKYGDSLSGHQTIIVSLNKMKICRFSKRECHLLPKKLSKANQVISCSHSKSSAT